MTYKGRYSIKKPEKYIGDPNKVVYRSLWERQTFKWIENNINIIEWCSEEVVIPYLCETDNKVHRYYVDLYFKTIKEEQFLIEIKPKKETEVPKKNNNRKTYLTESLTYIKNMSKWKAARKFCDQKGWKFQIWTEETLKGLGIKIINSNARYKTNSKKRKS